MKIQEIRENFVKFFKNNDHQKISSSSLIPHNDDTLLFANAGMNQFKDFFTGLSKPQNKRAVSIQKCVRAGGKHNDLENVGLTARHHTFFEMMGNFSFGDYFKVEAIEMGWEFLTKVLCIPEEKLFITVHHTDDEAFDIWNKKIGIPAEKIFRKGDKDNFWEMGEFGPCGPCSEIFYDHGPDFIDPDLDKSSMKDILDDENRYVEIWNLVFMQYEKTKEGRINLPNPSVDTGMGLERTAAVMQGKYWNYDTDAFTPIIEKIEKLSQKKYSDTKYTSSMRIIADHIRSSVMLITDGVIPSNEGRGYVLRRIIRRAVRHLKELDASGSFAKLVPIVLDTLGKEYPQNKKNQSLAEKILKLEETKFLETLDQGLKFLNEAIKKDLEGDTLKGESAFKLYDTYGFPLDLTEVILNEKNLSVDIKGFNKAMKKQKEDSKKSWKGGIAVDDKVFHESRNKNGTTVFKGYDSLIETCELLDIIDLGESKGLIFKETPFYGESGGQAGDQGRILDGENVIAEVFDVQKPVDGLHVHFSKNADVLEVGKKYNLAVSPQTREAIKKNHSATHLLQAALIEILGDHVKQAGSLVNSDKLRFDFTHMQAVTDEELKQVEKLVNSKIQEQLDVKADIMSMDEALKKGAMALFGEKYGDSVRVLKMGDFSTELCGGIHVNNTSEIGLFSILSESSLSTGIRRIEAVTSHAAITRLNNRSDLFKKLEQITSSKNLDVIAKVESLYLDLKAKQKNIQELKDSLDGVKSKDLFNNVEKMSNYDFLISEAPEGSDMRKLSDNFVSKYPEGILVIYTKKGEKISALVRKAKKVENLKCNVVLQKALEEINGRGGGKPDMAQGSGDWSGVETFKNKIKELVATNI